jgi:hypothetical protein
MLYTDTNTSPFGPPVHLVGTRSSRHLPTPEEAAVWRQQSEVIIDDALSESFPASDPPGWNSTMARPMPRDTSPDRANGIPIARELGETASGIPGVIDVSRPARFARTPLQAFASLVGAAGLALLVPLAILLVGLPIALAGRGVLEVLAWLLGD